MEQRSKEIINNYIKEISLFQDLLSCVTRERENLINQDIKGIWDSLEEKETILASIEESRRQMNNIAGDGINMSDFQVQDRDKIRELSRALIHLKLDIKTRVKENVSFINETLEFFHDLISAMTMTENDRPDSYGRTGVSKKSPRSVIYQGEA